MEIPIRRIILNTGLRFRTASFKADYHSEGNLEEIRNEYRNLAGTGFDLYAGLIFNL